jgi:vitamin B12 transporter
VVAGVNAEQSNYKSIAIGKPLQDKASGVYLSSDFHPLVAWSITAGSRYDHFDTAGDATTGRLGTAYRLSKTDTKFRATVGTAFNAPAMTERYGEAPWYAENPSLRPERSTGWDAGVDQAFCNGNVTLEATYFQNKFRDMIVGEFVGGLRPYQWQNIARARTEGAELGTVAKLTKTLKVHISATYLDVYDTTSGRARVAYKPRKSGDADLDWQATKQWNLGAGIHYVADRMQSATVKMSDYSLVRFYTSYKVAKNLLLKFRVENALNRDYQEIYGYPALSRGYFGGVEWRF